jgi:CRP-like cAMP-binding protein
LAKISFGAMRLIDRRVLAGARLQTVELSYRPEEIVYERGAAAQFIYAVEEGALFRFQLVRGERRSIRQFLFRGDGFGYEITRHHRDTVQVLTDTKVLAVGREALLEAASSDAGLSNLLFKAAAIAVVAGEDQAEMLRVGTATEQIAQFLLEMEARLSVRGEIDLPMRNHHIGDYLGLTLETVSRAINAFEREKIIEFLGTIQKRRLVIRDRQRLQRLASDSADFDYGSVLKKRKATNTLTAPTLQ